MGCALRSLGLLYSMATVRYRDFCTRSQRDSSRALIGVVDVVRNALDSTRKDVMNSSPTIALLDHLGGGNLGDDATLDAMMRNVKIRLPDAKLVALSMNPSDTQTRHGIPCYPIRREVWDFNETTFIQSREL